MRNKLLMIAFILASCNNNSKPYIISEQEAISRNSVRGGSIVYYGYYNYVLDSSNNLYYYSFQKPNKKDLLNDEGPFKPHFAGLMPNHVFVIPKGNEKIFFKSNVLDNKSSYRKFVVVSSEKDTIRNDFLNYILKLSKDTSMHLYVFVRSALDEERVVIKYKNNGEFYDPKLIKWDSSKVFFSSQKE